MNQDALLDLINYLGTGAQRRPRRPSKGRGQGRARSRSVRRANARNGGPRPELVQEISCEATQLDPVQDPTAEERDRNLRPVPELQEACHRAGDAPPTSMPSLVAIQRKGKVWVVFGNRRLKALEDAARDLRAEVKVLAPVMVHRWGCVSPGLAVKFVDSCTSTDGVKTAEYNN